LSVQPKDAFLYNQGTMIDLNAQIAATLGWTLNSATAINDFGQIVGYGSNARGTTQSFLLTPALMGDANLDGRVDVNDLTVVLTSYGGTGLSWNAGDFNDDGRVDVNDLTILLTDYGQSLGRNNAASAVPEPSALLLAAVGLGFLALAVRRGKRQEAND
jgi:probable HAF family extracellular repeat protein